MGIRQRLASWLTGDRVEASAVTVKIDDSRGWQSLTGRPQDYDAGTIVELYNDALEAWRKNPIAWRIISITTDYVIGDRVAITSPKRDLARFIQAFWNHPQNRLDLRLEAMSDELARSGDLFVALFRNKIDGMSYIRFVTKDRIQQIETAPHDWETELVYLEVQDTGEPRRWYSPDHPDADKQPAIMLHYSVNRPVGALMGEGDLTTMLPWLQRYSRMLEDRVRLHWAMRAFLWIVTVPSNKINEKQLQYSNPMDSGSIVVKDETEVWEAVNPALHGADAGNDMKAVRGMIDAGSGYPPHWRGEAADANLATAQAMQGPTERHLARRQKYFNFMLKDILYQSYKRAVEIGKARNIKIDDYEDTFIVSSPDVSRTDNESLARASKDMITAFEGLAAQLPGRSPALTRLMLKLFSRFAGEPMTDSAMEEIMREVEANPHKKPVNHGDTESTEKSKEKTDE